MGQVAAAGVTILTAVLASVKPSPSPPPLQSGVTETVEVRLVTIDAVVLDAEDRAVQGLDRDAFELDLDGKPAEIVAVDESGRPSPSPPGPPAASAVRSPAPSGASPRPRIVLALDYPHLILPHRRDRGAYVASIVHRLELQFGSAGTLETDVMLVALAGGLRTVQPFTRDAGTLVASLRRMRDDPTLYGGQFGHLTERRFFEDLNTLMATLGNDPGSKAVVLFSAGNEPDTVRYDLDFRDLAARAADARAAIYTVDSEGLEPMELSRSRDPVGGAPGLARLAADTGGRMTRNANDLEIGYRRAAADLACRYTLSFRERGAPPKEPHTVTLRVRRAGLRVVYPSWVR